MRSRGGLVVGLIALLWATLPAAGQETVVSGGGLELDDQELSWNRRATLEFDRLCERRTEASDAWFGGSQIDRLLAAAKASDDGSIARATSLAQAAWHEIRLARLDDAIGHLGAALSIVDAVDGPSQQGTVPFDLEANLLTLLGVAHLLVAEDQNCLSMHDGGSCILPVTSSSIHKEKGPARRAAQSFDRLLRLARSNGDATYEAEARWLLNIARMLTGDWPDGVEERDRLPAPRIDSPAATTLRPFVDMLAPGRLSGDHHSWLNSADLSGGAIVDDFDGDGRLDLISSSWHPCEPLRALRSTGAGFEDATADWQLDGQSGGLNLVHADFDGDGRLDILVLRGAWLGETGRQRNSLLHNRVDPGGRTYFVDVTYAVGLASPSYPTQTAAWADYDRDGDLDLYIGNESPESALDPQAIAFDQPGSAAAYPSQLFRNELSPDGGLPRFVDAARTAGALNRRFAKGVTWGDVDNDGWPDLYISNFGVNRLYRNLGDGTFEDIAGPLGVDGDGRTFATWFFDADNDGDLDLLVNGYGTEVATVFAAAFGSDSPATAGDASPRLYRNLGVHPDGRLRFRDDTRAAGLSAPRLVMGANFGDVDADGRLDLYLGTGVPNFTALMPDVLYRNASTQETLRFEDVTAAVGLGHLQKGHGIAWGDVDNDGDEDIFHQLGGAYPYDSYPNALFVNPLAPQAGEAVVLLLEAAGANRFAVGARVTFDFVGQNGEPGESRIHRQVGSGGSFGSSSLRLEVGLREVHARGERLRRVRVRWPASGDEEVFDWPPAGETAMHWRLREGAGIEAVGAPEMSWIAPRIRP